MNDKLKFNKSAKDDGILESQKGALIIGLIITMVVFSVISSALVYIFSSSALNPVSGNYAQQAYYNAEAGFRYLAAEYRHSIDPAAGRTAVLNYVTEQTKTLSNGTVTLKIANLVTPYVPATATAVLNGSDLVLSGVTGTFPSAPGFFRIGTDATVYRYMGMTNESGTIKLSQIFPGGYTSGTITTLEHAAITSTGTCGSGLWAVNRKVNYVWVLSGFPSGGGPIGGGPSLPDLDELVDNNPFGNSTDLGSFETIDVGGQAITVAETSGGSAEAVLGFSADPNPLVVAWNYAGHFLSYDVQIKIGTGVWDGSAFDKNAGTPTVAEKGYIAGLTFRSKGVTPGLWQQYGLSFAKYNSSSDNLRPTMNPTGIYPDLNSGSSPYPLDAKGWSVDEKKYYKCTAASCTVDSNGNLGAGWVEHNPPMILLWTRNSNETDGEYWLAYKLLEDEPAGGIVDADGLLKDWSTIMLRVVEGASFRFTSGSTGFLVGETVTGPNGTGKVIKKIQTTAGQDVIILNNITGTFATNDFVSSPNQASIQTAEYRLRDNYIWGMFGDTDSHPTLDTTAINNTRGGNARIANDSIVNSANTNCYIHWPETDMAGWGTDITENCSSPQTVKNDYFKLMMWNTNLNTDATNGDPGMLIMGTGKEADAILRLSRWTTQDYTTVAFPYEIGFHTLGESATKTFFDDLALNFPGQTTPGGVDYVPPVQQ